MKCDIAVNPIKKGSAGSIINKVNDYAMAGLPVINTQESTEYRSLLEKYHAGINCECENVGQITVALRTLISDAGVRKKMGQASREMGLALFDRANTYKRIVDRIVSDLWGGVIHLAYVGTLGSSYDLPLVFDAMRELPEEVLRRIDFIVMGDGPGRRLFEIASEDLPVEFTGALPYPEMVWLLAHCDIALNPIVPGAAQSIINKHMDYAMAGIPVINTQECKEYRELLFRYNAGINCDCHDAAGLAEAIEKLVTNEDMRLALGRNHRKMGEECFDRRNTYPVICKAVDRHMPMMTRRD